MSLDFPATPTVGQQFGSGTTTWVFDGTAWNIVPQLSPAVASDLPPSNPAVGQFWWRSTNGKLYLYVDDGNSKQWVEAGSAGAIPGGWEKVTEITLTGQVQYDIPNLGAYSKLKVHGAVYIGGSTAAPFGMRFSKDGTTFFAGASDYAFQSVVFTGSTVAASINQNVSFCYLSGTADVNSVLQFNHQIENFNSTPIAIGLSRSRQSSALAQWQFASNIQGQTGQFVAMRLVNGVGATMTGSFAVEGWRP